MLREHMPINVAHCMSLGLRMLGVQLLAHEKVQGHAAKKRVPRKEADSVTQHYTGYLSY